jgi:hypothetical protein
MRTERAGVVRCPLSVVRVFTALSGRARSGANPADRPQSLDPRTTDNGQRTTPTAVLAALAVTVVPRVLEACPVCFGDPSSPMTKGVDNGVLFLLGVIGFVQIGFVALFIAFWRRAKHLRETRQKFRLIEGGAH